MPPIPKTKPKCIGIVGSRRRDDDLSMSKCYKAFEEIYVKGDIIVSGGCPRGGDRFAEVFARNVGATIIIHHADWSKGKTAGFERNTTIAMNADVIIAVVAEDRTGGTEDTIKKATRFRKKIILGRRVVPFLFLL